MLLTHHEHDAPFLRAMIAILQENPLHVDDGGLIQDEESYIDTIARPDDEKIWYDILSNHVEDVVHFWRQCGLDR